MVAYSFKPSFIPLILSREKQQTIRQARGGRARHARPGEALQLYTGMRTRACRKLGDATCAEVHEVRLDFADGRVTVDDAIELTTPAELSAFAILDGFRGSASLQDENAPWERMRRWWALTHPDQPVFRGVLITWSTSLVPAAA